MAMTEKVESEQLKVEGVLKALEYSVDRLVFLEKNKLATPFEVEQAVISHTKIVSQLLIARQLERIADALEDGSKPIQIFEMLNKGAIYGEQNYEEIKDMNDETIEKVARKVIRRYVDMPKADEDKAVEFVLASWRAEDADDYCVLMINGVRSTGKTKLLESLQMVCKPETRLVDAAGQDRRVPLQGAELGWNCAALVDYEIADVDPAIFVSEIVMKPREIDASMYSMEVPMAINVLDIFRSNLSNQ